MDSNFKVILLKCKHFNHLNWQVDQKTKDLLDAHIKKKKSKLKMPENDNALDERTKVGFVRWLVV